MTDWADEEAETITSFVSPHASEIAAALRAAFLRGRVAGLLEGAEFADDLPRNAILAAARKLEKGEAP